MRASLLLVILFLATPAPAACFAWGPVPVASFYKVYWGLDKDSITNWVSTTNITTCIEELSATNTTYWLNATANLDEFTESGRSNTIQYYTGLEPNSTNVIYLTLEIVSTTNLNHPLWLHYTNATVAITNPTDPARFFRTPGVLTITQTNL